VKTWAIGNSGIEPWPANCSLSRLDGTINTDTSSHRSMQPPHIPPLMPGEQCDITVHLRSPEVQGIHQSRWRLQTANGIGVWFARFGYTSSTGVPFGDIIWCIVTVENSGLLGITQQMAAGAIYDARAADSPSSGGPGSSYRNPFGQSSPQIVNLDENCVNGLST
jgi:hypothetical protein